MSTPEDEKSPKAKAAKAARAPRAKKVATAVIAAVTPDTVFQPTLPNVASSSNALETPVNRASSSIDTFSTVVPTASPSTHVAQPLGANLSSYAPAAVATNEPAPNNVHLNGQLNGQLSGQLNGQLSGQLLPTQRPKISPLAPPSVDIMSNSLPASLLNTPQESVSHATTDASKPSHSATDSISQPAQLKVVKLPSDKNSTRNNLNANSSDDKNSTAQRDLRLAGTATVNTASAATAQVAATKAIAPTHHASEQPGVMLRQAREARGLSVADVANRLRMGNRQVTALEAGQFEDLPEGTFLRGFARNFSKVVGADTDAVLAALEAVNPDAAAPSTGIAPPVQNMQYSQHRPEPSRFSPKLGLLGLVAVALTGAAWYWFEYVRTAPSVTTPPVITAPSASAADATNAANTTPAPTPATDTNGKASDAVTEPATAIGTASPPLTSTITLTPPGAPLQSAPTASPPTPATLGAVTPNATGNTANTANSPISVDRIIDKNTPASSVVAPVAAAAAAVPPADTAKPGSSRLAFVFTDTSWVEVADARGNLIVNRTFKKGETHQVDGRTPFSIVVGNAKNATMQYNGAPFDLAPHTKVSVARLRLK